MKRHLNNKGYMLVEIILASALAMVVAYFITDLTIKLKNKNDDLLVKTLVSTDQSIIYNTLMRDIYSNPNVFSCDDIDHSNFSSNIFKYKDFTNIVSEYASIGTFSCNDSSDGGFISIQIPLDVKQLPDDNFDININYMIS